MSSRQGAKNVSSNASMKHRDQLKLRRMLIILLALGVSIYFIVEGMEGSMLESLLSKNPHSEFDQNSSMKQGLRAVKQGLRGSTTSFIDTSLSFLPPLPISGDVNEFGDYRPRILKDVTIIHPSVKLTTPIDATYPVYKSLLDVVTEWSPDRPEPPSTFKETLMHFDYMNVTERKWALNFRTAEIPFKVYNVPEFASVSKKWTNTYLSNKFRKQNKRTSAERSKNNHFMFWSQRNRKDNKLDEWKPPTKRIKMTYDEWLELAKDADRTQLGNSSEHYYFMFGTGRDTRGSTFMDKDLEYFSSNKANFFVFNPRENKGIQCRFGMRGVIAESHYDGGRNMVAMLRGTKRYILNPPESCDKLGIIQDINHPSFRHSIIDWSDINQARFSHFDKVNAIDTIVREGEVLYIPSFWFHYIISLEYSIQCNSRSGSPEGEQGQNEIDKCLNLSKQKKRKKKKRLG